MHLAFRFLWQAEKSSLEARFDAEEALKATDPLRSDDFTFCTDDVSVDDQ